MALEVLNSFHDIQYRCNRDLHRHAETDPGGGLTGIAVTCALVEILPLDGLDATGWQRCCTTTRASNPLRSDPGLITGRILFPAWDG